MASSGIDNAILQRVDRALAKVGARVAVNTSTAVSAMLEAATMTKVMATGDTVPCTATRALENLSKSIGVLPHVRIYASNQDKFGASAADLAAEAGHMELAVLLRNLMKTDADLALDAKRAKLLTPSTKDKGAAATATTPAQPARQEN